MPNYRLDLSYDGTRYRGWQRQGNTENTLQAKLEAALEQVCGEKIEAAASGRTDAGVHARMQVVSFRTQSPLEPQELLRRLRQALPEDMGALAIQPAQPRFHARLSCTGKTYLYRIWNSPVPNVFDRRFQTVVEQPLDVAAMEQAAKAFLGSHDFRGFCSNPNMKKSTVRTVTDISVRCDGPAQDWYFSGDGFLYNMVRILMGTLLEVGLGHLCPTQIPEILAARDRAAAGPMAPAKGLCLWEVRYDG